MQSMNIRRTEAGILDSGGDIDTSMTWVEAGLERFTDLAKDAFIYREALKERLGSRCLFWLTCDGRTPSGGLTVLDGASQVGTTTTGAYSPYLKTGIAYTRFDQADGWPGRTLTLQSADGSRAACQIITLPFSDR